MTQNPVFSVVVIAHDRKEYLLEALKSISQQTLRKEFFEVIVVKNFVDRDSDDYAMANNFELVLTDVVPVGAKMSVGIEKSKGKYIAFLEDDDLFAASKLAYIYERIRDGNIGFVHNSYELIDDKGKTLPTLIHESSVFFEKDHSFLGTCRKYGLNSHDLVLSSCMVILKVIITPYLMDLTCIESAPDLFVLFSFLSSAYTGIHLKDRLTKYRLHQSQSNRTGSETKFVENNLEIRRSWIADYNIMKKTFAKGEAHDLAEYSYRYNSLFELVLLNERNILKKAINGVCLLRVPGPFRYYPSIGLMLAGFLSILSPRVSHQEYYKYRKNKYVSTFY